ncbi:hypothetical protein [Companilactobacillus heilongjiangensis]|uniref:Uncharacterized protein n=1 Tax=Companilactobacillus heilongjiangensis TaxID=1074467 RepID=A0A0K2LEH4_9LACO|nr:hypothetical protein [Companilactobacillus heilongjiangensis]ALB29578.1 hypothetical protein JP39_09560 [Companilactobacillus heilongjiangensis]
MRNKMRKILGIGFSALVSIFVIFSFNTNKASAALTDSTDLAVLKSAPTGIPVDSYMSNAKPTVSFGYPYGTNSAQIVDNTGQNSDSGNIISLANNKNTYGSMWSTAKSFDINKKQTISAWLYFGSGEGSDDVNSEGIAFVLQNDSKNTSALGAGLESMGVYGYDSSSYTAIGGTVPSPSDIQKTAIQNSIALEFDTEKNSFYLPSKPISNKYGYFSGFLSTLTSYSLNGYDTQVSPPPSDYIGFPTENETKVTYGSLGGQYGHIAVTYPGFATSYKDLDFTDNPTLTNDYSPWKKGYVLVHNNSNSASLTDGTDQNGNVLYWHHVTIKWTPAPNGSNLATLTYDYNDKNLDYSDNNIPSGWDKKLSVSNTVDTSKLNTTDGKVRWGFTAANGPSDSVSTKLVAFDSTPDTLYADADANIIDTTLNNKKITSASTDKTVGNGDSLKLNYDLTYKTGSVNWKDILANIKIPNGVTITPDSYNNIGTITFNDGYSQTISTGDITNDNITSQLDEELSPTNDTAKITINAKAVNATTKDIDVKQAPATFNGSNEISSTNSPEFTILARPTYSLNLTNSNSTNEIDLLYKQTNATLNLPTTLNYSDNHSFGNDSANTNIVYKITAGNKTYTVAANASGDSFNQTFDLKDLINDDTDFWTLFTPKVFPSGMLNKSFSSYLGVFNCTPHAFIKIIILLNFE